MSLKLQLKMRDSIKVEICKIFRDTMSRHANNDYFQTQWRCIAESDRFKNLPLYMQNYLYGYRDALFVVIQSHLVFSYVIDGKRWTIESAEYKAYAPSYVHQFADTGAYVWQSEPDKIFM